PVARVERHTRDAKGLTRGHQRSVLVSFRAEVELCALVVAVLQPHPNVQVAQGGEVSSCEDRGCRPRPDGLPGVSAGEVHGGRICRLCGGTRGRRSIQEQAGRRRRRPVKIEAGGRLCDCVWSMHQPPEGQKQQTLKNAKERPSATRCEQSSQNGQILDHGSHAAIIWRSMNSSMARSSLLHAVASSERAATSSGSLRSSAMKPGASTRPNALVNNTPTLRPRLVS